MKLEMFNILSGVANTLVITLVMFTFLNKMYEPKYKQKYIYFFAYVGAVFFKYLISNISIPIINALYAIISIEILCIILYKCKLREATLYNICYVCMLLFADVLSVVLFAVTGGDTLTQILGNRMMMFFSSILNWIFVVLGLKLILYFFKRGERSVISRKEIIFLLYVTGFELLIILYITTIISKHSSGIFLILLLFGFLLLNLYITRLLEQVACNIQLKCELGLARQQSNIAFKHFQELTREQDIARKVTHDVRKHIDILNELYANGDKINAKEYTGLLDKELDKLIYGFTCKNKILSVILGFELRKAETLQIKMELDIEDIPMDFIEDLDVTAIFANLLDNAIEACCILEVAERSIKVGLFRFNDFIVLNVSNPISKIPKKNGRVFETTKEGHEGIGLSNVIGSVEKYNGNFKVEILNNNFIVKITMPIME